MRNESIGSQKAEIENAGAWLKALVIAFFIQMTMTTLVVSWLAIISYSAYSQSQRTKQELDTAVQDMRSWVLIDARIEVNKMISETLNERCKSDERCHNTDPSDAVDPRIDP